jgi:predicted RNA binding protein YcfA (HicA-like mRNA interferase family)
MPKLGPIKHKQLIKNLRQLGFDGPFGRGAKHDVMQKGDLTIVVPTKHGSGVINDVGLLKRILRQAGIDIKEWEKL